MKSHGVTIQMDSLQQYFHKILFIWQAVLTSDSVDPAVLPFKRNLFRKPKKRKHVDILSYRISPTASLK